MFYAFEAKIPIRRCPAAGRGVHVGLPPTDVRLPQTVRVRPAAAFTSVCGSLRLRLRLALSGSLSAAKTSTALTH